ncbi:anti sigma factor C-terminal domain-containing protein [Clostridium ganghwense]|uniref:Anti sigma factor C-terminal domain-containing protein n=1 Tax=Clostridium ganghwense TaxID=312089 RepID=A0ABT4CMH1_9CLOT|nr:anti sigma factor C-terminal domain-containing protein [Clostridium ganghwense]MCY6370252.1 anti sigma factor C-terminal domain-containing protein [Clostridium ganghwense]
MSNKNDLNVDEKNIDELFENCKKNKLSKVVRKAKWFSIIRNIIICIFVIIAISIANLQALGSKGQKLLDDIKEFNYISAPNTFISQYMVHVGGLNGDIQYYTYKIVEDKPMYFDQKRWKYSIIPLFSEMIADVTNISIGKAETEQQLYDNPKYNKYGRELMKFYYPYVKYDKYQNDLQLVDKIGDNKSMEMVLSFDKLYSIDEVNKLIPKDITLTWYWVDTSNDKEKEEHKSSEMDYANDNTKKYISPNEIALEDKVYGIKVLDRHGVIKESPENTFIDVIESQKDKKSRFQSEYKRIYDNLKGKDNKVTKDDLKIQGVVVTGNVEEMKKLKELPFIKASSLGIVVDKY